MNEDLLEVIQLAAKALDYYEREYGDDLFPNKRKNSFQEMFYTDLTMYSLVLCTSSGSVSNEQIRRINYYCGTNYPTDNGEYFHNVLAQMRDAFSDSIPNCINAVIIIENLLDEYGQMKDRKPLLNSLISIFDHLAQDLVTCDCTYKAEAVGDNAQFAGAYLDRLREYVREKYFNPQLIEDSTIYKFGAGKECQNGIVPPIVNSDKIAKKLEAMGLALDPEKKDDSAHITCENSSDFASYDAWGELICMSIDELGLSVRSYNCLIRSGIETVGDLMDITLEDLHKIRNLGKKSADEIIKKVHALGVGFLKEGL